MGVVSHYSALFISHLAQPRHQLRSGLPPFIPDGMGLVRGAAPDSFLQLWIKVDDQGLLSALLWQVRGMPLVVPSTSFMAEWVLAGGARGQGMSLEQALSICPDTLARRMGGLPSYKAREMVRGPEALRSAIGAYLHTTGLMHPLQAGTARGEELICQCLGVSGAEFSEVSARLTCFERVQDTLGVGTGCGTCEGVARALFAYERYQV